MNNSTIREKIGVGLILLGVIGWLLYFKDGFVVAYAKDFIVLGILVWLSGYLRKKLFKKENEPDDKG